MTADSPPEVAFYPKQVDFLELREPFAAFCGGIGSGKSHVLCYDGLRRFRDRLYMVTAPTYPVLRDATMRTFFELTELLEMPTDYHRSEHLVYLPRENAEVLFRSTENPRLLRGPNLAGVLMDEASLCSREAYRVLVGRLRQAGEFGWLRAAFTPQGRGHWTYETFGAGKPDTALVTARTDENPFLPEEFYETVRRQYGETSQYARQELGGEFVQMEGAEFPAEWFERPGLWFHEWPQDLPWRVIYVDPSSGANELTDLQAVCSVGMGPPDNTLYADCWVGRDNPPTGLIPRVLNLVDSWGPVDVAAFERNATMGFLDAEVERVMAGRPNLVNWWLVTNRKPKIDRIRKLGFYLENSRIRFRRTDGGQSLVGQLCDFPRGEFDDACDALAGAVDLLERITHPGG